VTENSDIIETNRAPVLTLWASVVAERMGYERDEALSLGKVMAGLTAQAKGRTLGIYKPRERTVGAKRKRGEEFFVELCGQAVPAVRTDGGVRAVAGDKPVTPESVEAYLRRSFGPNLARVREAMTAVAASVPPDQIKEVSYGLYQQFRPGIPSGKRGWGAKGALDLGLMRSMAGKKGD
jgi:hypothetical protein